MIKLIAKLHYYCGQAYKRLLMYFYRTLFASCGKNFCFDPRGLYTYKNIYVGDDVNLGFRPSLMAAESKIRIGNKVFFGPEVMILAGDHNTSVINQFMFDVLWKRPENDLNVVIEDDVWVGSRAVILKGVTIGRGSIIAAGAIVNKNVPPYALAAGVPARVMKFRWDVDTIMRHEEKLYPPEKRLTREILLESQKKELLQ